MDRKQKGRLQRYRDIICYTIIVLSILALIWSAFVPINEAVSNRKVKYPIQEIETDATTTQEEINIPVEIRIMSTNTARQNEPESITQIQLKEPLYGQSDIVTLAKLMFVECGGVSSDTEKACVAWTVLNRADAWDMSIKEVVESPNQFAYSEQTPISEDLYDLASDVLTRWNAERNGETSVGRVLPRDYTYFAGDGTHNYFRNGYKGDYSIWDYSLPSPYES